MKKLILLFLGFALCLTSCIEDEYDLSDVSTDNITLGEEALRIPLVKIRVSSADLNRNGLNIEEMFAEANDWLPSDLGADYADLIRLTADRTYLDGLLDNLIAEMSSSSEKRMVVARRIVTEYKQEFLEALDLPSNVSDEEFLDTFNANFDVDPIIRNKVKELADSYLQDLSIDPMSFRIDNVNITDDMIKMLTKNLDPRGTAEPKSTLHLYGELRSALPLTLDLNPRFEGTSVQFNIAVDATEEKSPIAESESTRIYAEDLRTIVHGVQINIPLLLRRYYPRHGFNAQGDQIVIDLRLVKRGGLNLDI